MSTDTYFDFHSAQLWPFHKAMDVLPDAWYKWHEQLEFLEKIDSRDKHYCPERVAYVSNLLADCTFDLWKKFQEKWYGAFLDKSSIKQIIEDWEKIYNITQLPENEKYCYMPDDICSPAEIIKLLENHIGDYISFRVD